MDVDWCRDRLQEYFDAVGEYDALAGAGFGSFEWQAVEKRRPTVTAILKAIDPGDGSLSFDEQDNWDTHKSKVLQGIGALKDRDELSRALAPDTPALSADQMHPWVWEPARSLWEIGQFRQALLAVCTAINAHLQAKVGRRDASDDKLVQECFSEKPPIVGKPRLRVPGDPIDQTVQSLQRGTLQMALGCVWAIRNPAAHLAAHDAGELDEQAAFEQLAALSVLARLLDQCAVETANDGAEDSSS